MFSVYDMIDMGFRLPTTVPKMNSWEAWWTWMVQLNTVYMRTYATLAIQNAYNEFMRKKEIDDEKREVDNMLKECFDHVVIDME
jgi:hypothetical protein